MLAKNRSSHFIFPSNPQVYTLNYHHSSAIGALLDLYITITFSE